ncbi:MAG: outer membrane lipoprotein chaperone LolA [Rubrivivax sp.]|nr:outer membrane lipoprotein chaperone LolA [Rubrivivax sp.]
MPTSCARPAARERPETTGAPNAALRFLRPLRPQLPVARGAASLALKSALCATWVAACLGLAAPSARADGVERLREFAREVKGGEARFTQTVTSADGSRRKVSTGSFAFLRPNRFRFAYDKPVEQLIVSDGQKVWIYDADLDQASSRPLAKALGQTPAALLAGTSPEQDFVLAAEPAREGLEWVRAAPKQREGATFQALRVAFRGKELAAVEITDNFGQRSLLQFTGWAPAAGLPAAERFRFVPPPGAEVVEQ